MENKWLGSKTQGFYKKEGKEILTLDLDTLEYRAAKSFFATLELIKQLTSQLIALRFL
jgi:3-hydroxyacyl-CoA dehydrogenase